MTEEYIKWESRLNTGVELIDQQHKTLVSLTNDLYAACLHSDKAIMDAQFREAMKKAVEYVKVHFRDEEELSRSAGYPKYKDHKIEHEEFIKKVLDAVMDYQSGKQFVPNNFVRFLKDWLWEHIAVSDKELAKYLLSQGIK